MSGGGKGGSTTSEVKVPEYVEEAARRNLNKAEAISRIGYTPYYGPDVAAFTPMQEAAFQNTADAASAFGMSGGNMSAQNLRGGMAAPTSYAGGARGYSSAPMYEDALKQLRKNSPGQKEYIDSFFIDPVTGAPGSNTQPSIYYTQSPAMALGGGGGSDGVTSDGKGGVAVGGGGRGGGLFNYRQGPNLNGSAGYGIGGYTSLRDTVDRGGAGKSGGGCFLTTAIVDRRGEADDGPTLSKLRNFRDTYMASDPEMAADIARYYDVAPQIVATIPEGDPDWDWIGSQVDKSIYHIDANELSEAYDVYGSMVKKLMSKWIDAKGSY